MFIGKFLSKIFKLIDEAKPMYFAEWRNFIGFEEADDVSKDIRRRTHKTIKKATADIDRFAFNTYVSSLMIYVNDLTDLVAKHKANPSRAFALSLSEAIETLILLLSPAAPHSADELWHDIGKSDFTVDVSWPVFVPALAVDDTVTVAVQVNGKLRETLEMEADATNEAVEAAAKALPKVAAHLEGKTIRKVIVVPRKLVNFVAS